MGVVGIDLSTNTFRVAVAPGDENISFCDVKVRDNHDVKVRDAQFAIPAAISFDGKRRIIGGRAIGRPDCFSEIMSIVGKRKSDLEANPQLSSLLNKGPNDLLECITDLELDRKVNPTQLLAMVLSYLKALAEFTLKVDSANQCCIAIPAYFSNTQCIAVRQAAQIAGFTEVSLVTSVTATALGQTIVRDKALNLGITANINLAVIDTDCDVVQIAILNMKRGNLDLLSYGYVSSTSDVDQLLDNVVTQAGITKQQINRVLVTGSRSNSVDVQKCLFPVHENAELAKTKVVPVADIIARGCAVLCAIKSKLYVSHKDLSKLKAMQCLVNFKVTDKCPLVNDEVDADESTEDGRVVLTVEEIIDARKYEHKLALREKLRCKISELFQLNEFSREEEIAILENAEKQLNNDNLDKEYTCVTAVEKTIRARKNEHDCKDDMRKKLERKIQEYGHHLKSMEPKYRTIKKSAKDSLKQMCSEQRVWLNEKIKILSVRAKNDDPISFIEDTNERIKFLELAWAEVQEEREPEIVELTYHISHETFHSNIDDFRLQLLKEVPEIRIMDCFLLPYQTEVAGVPCKWFQVKLVGRNDEFTVSHIKHHNVYTMGFGNMVSQVFEMGPGGNEKREDNNKMEPGQNEDNEMEPGRSEDNKMEPGQNEDNEMEPGQNEDNEMEPGQNKDSEEIEPWNESTAPDTPKVLRLTIVGSKYAGFNCDYVNMINPLKKPWSKKKRMQKFEKIKLGIEPWLDSVHVLAYHGDNLKHNLNCSLCRAPYAVQRAVMCNSIMLNECTRMSAVKEAVGAGLSGMNLFELMLQYIWFWKAMSVLLRSWNADPTLTSVGSDVSKCIKVSDIAGVAVIMHLVLNTVGPGMMKSTNDQGALSRVSRPSGGNDGDRKGKGKKQAGPSSPSEPHDHANKEQSQPPSGLGHNLLEIFSVTPENIKLSDILAILVHDQHGSHAIYSSDDTEKQEFKLSGPGMAISSECGCLLEVVPKTGNKYGASEEDLLNLDDGCSSYNQHMMKTLPYGYGKLDVSYAILTEAVEATLKINLKLGLIEPSCNVTGLIEVAQSSGSSFLSVEHASVEPFHEPNQKELANLIGMANLYRSISVNLQLSRSVLAVKLGDCIRVAGNLFIGKQPFEFSQVVNIPKEVDFIDNVHARWAVDKVSRIAYRASMIIINRNM